MSMQRLRLMIPGPIELDQEVLAVMSEPLVAHYGKEWTAFYKETTQFLQEIFQTDGDAFLIPGSGSASLDAALGSTLFPDGKVLIPKNGFFGERLKAIARSYTASVQTIDFPVGQAVDLAEVERALQNGDFDALACVHCETSTGVLNPIQELAKLCHSHGVLFIVDAVSSLAIEPLDMDAWGIDVAISASQKGLEAPPGLGIVAVGKQGWGRIDHVRSPGWYLNLKVWREYADKWGNWHPHPVTQPANNIKALQVGVRRVLAEGLKQRFKRHRRVAKSLRQGLRKIGFTPYVPDEIASNGVTSVLGGEVDIDQLLTYVREKERILLAGSLRELKGKVFRIGHMGPEATGEAIESVLAALRNGLHAARTT